MAELAPTGTAATARGPQNRFAALEVRDLHKTFHVPKQQVHTFKERALHPLRGTRNDDLHILRGISFDVRQGEFFGIVGRNGSGKSTLLKCLAGIYRIDSGRIRAAGRISPFIELGVGFNPDLTARDNVVINAVMMGLTPREARARFDRIIAFAELEDFVDLKLKNYSSGMQVRLAFAVMVQSGAEILLIDEVLAVGDAAFQQRCFDEFARLRDEGRTIVLVTHDMELVERFCHRAMLITKGEIEVIGEPTRVGERYIERNFERYESIGEHGGEANRRAEITDMWVENEGGMHTDSAPYGQPLHLHMRVEARAHVAEPVFEMWVDDEEGARAFAASTETWPETAPLEPGDRVHVKVNVDNRFRSGRYHVGGSVLSGNARLEVVALLNRHRSFSVFAGDHVYGLVQLDHDLSVEREP